jgi:hypothetical protein
MPYVKQVELAQIPPSTLKINISLEIGVFGIKLGGDYYVLSEDFKALEKISETEISEKSIIAGLLYDNIIIFRTHTIKECYVGKKVKFQDEDITRFLSEVYDSVKENRIDGMIREIDITNKFDVKINYEERFLVKFKSFEDAETKILTLTDMINNLDEMDREAKGEIERLNEGTWSFTYKNKLFD